MLYTSQTMTLPNINKGVLPPLATFYTLTRAQLQNRVIDLESLDCTQMFEMKKYRSFNLDCFCRQTIKNLVVG